MQVQIAAKKFGSKGEWRGAVLVDGEFEDALTARPLDAMISEALAPVLLAAADASTEVLVTVRITIPQLVTDGS